MEIVDLHLHEPGPVLPWDDVSESIRDRLLHEVLLQMIDSVGVGAVVLNPVSSWGFATAAVASDPRRFAIVKTLYATGAGRAGAIITDDVEAADIRDRIIAASEEPGVIATRVLFHPSVPEELDRYHRGGYDRVFGTCDEIGLPVRFYAADNLDAVASIAQRWPNLQLVVDHLGISQPPLHDTDSPQWLNLPKVVSLAQYPNIALQVTAPGSLSNESYPYKDVWPHVAELLNTFGPDRMAWASDISRFRGRVGFTHTVAHALDDYAGKHNYMEAVAFWLYHPQLSESEKTKILGATTRALFNWPA